MGAPAAASAAEQLEVAFDTFSHIMQSQGGAALSSEFARVAAELHPDIDAVQGATLEERQEIFYSSITTTGRGLADTVMLHQLAYAHIRRNCRDITTNALSDFPPPAPSGQRSDHQQFCEARGGLQKVGI